MAIQSRNGVSAANAGAGSAWSIGAYPTLGNAASRSGGGGFTTDYCLITFASFAIPTGATINSVTFEFVAAALASDNSDSVDYFAARFQGGSFVEQIALGGIVGDGDLNILSTDDWVNAISVANINSGALEFAVQADWAGATAASMQAYVDATARVPTVTVVYTPDSGGGSPPPPPGPPPPPPLTIRRRNGLFGIS